ncbi:hypothetical protein Dda_7545 [Drechslerella dactyloides]|uniref:GAF domain-containing protein n=1 Tax=Drechslerella dactyloides TaxID=74499 RepID=A0AAD6NFN5_DREDA|nr:hypothetical protein Dda_7545 [Drechslerella dactyloides]
MAPKDSPKNPDFGHKSSSSGFKMFKMIRRKDRPVDLPNIDTLNINFAGQTYTSPSLTSPESPDLNMTPRKLSHSSGNDKYITINRIWNDSPVVNPLANPPKPREERIPPNMARRLNIHVQVPSASPTSPLRQFRRKLSAGTPYIPTNTSSLGSGAADGISHYSGRSKSTPTVDVGGKMEPPVDFTMEIRHRRLLEEMANNCARDPNDRKEWGYWFQAYTDGRFNMSNPPQTPPRDPHLLWIPTPFPADEFDRLKYWQALSRFDLELASQIEGDLRTVLRNAATALGADFASISLVDYESETFILNHPIRIGAETKIKRACSLGAHVMMGNDSMVLLDTSKDWRFRGNPTLGTGSSRINFYAGSPLISPDGYNIGVLAISSCAARRAFGKADLRSLNNFANVVSTHLERLLPENRRTLFPNAAAADAIGRGSEDSVVVSPSVRRATEPAIETGNFKAQVYTTHKSDVYGQQNLRKNKRLEARLEAEKKLTEASPFAQRTDGHQGGLPILPSLPIPPASIAILPPRAPPTPPSSTSLFSQKLAQRRYRSGSQTDTPPISPTTITNPPLDLPTFPPAQNLPQARSLISDVAKQIDFDYLYIIRLEPSTTAATTFADLLCPATFQIVMVHSYRRNPSPAGSANQALNTELHLKALRDRCGLTAVNGREGKGKCSGKVADDSYQVSVLVPVQRNYLDEKGQIVLASGEDEDAGMGRVCRGHILGAYKRRNTGDYKAAIEKLRTLAGQLEELMFPVGK